MPALDGTLLVEWDELWQELRTTIESFIPAQALVPGSFWKDGPRRTCLLTSVFGFAQTRLALEQIHGGTCVELRSDEIGEMNASFLRAIQSTGITCLDTTCSQSLVSSGSPILSGAMLPSCAGWFTLESVLSATEPAPPDRALIDVRPAA
jgi:hypothetical protein